MARQAASARKKNGPRLGQVLFNFFFSMNSMDLAFIAGVATLYVGGPIVVGSFLTVGSFLINFTDFITKTDQAEQVKRSPKPKDKETAMHYETILGQLDLHFWLRVYAYVGFFLSLTMLNPIAGPTVAIIVSSCFLGALVVMMLIEPMKALYPSVREFFRGRASQSDAFEAIEDLGPAPVPARTRVRRSAELEPVAQAADLAAVEPPALDDGVRPAP